jgi:hypothetical protein
LEGIGEATGVNVGALDVADSSGNLDIYGADLTHDFRQTKLRKLGFKIPLHSALRRRLRLRWTARKAVKAERSERSLALTG